MPTINVSRVVKNSRFAQNYHIYREKGSFVAGRWTQTTLDTILMFGVVTAAGTKDIIQVPEGDRSSQIMVFHSVEKLYVTHVDTCFSGISDKILWKGSYYRLFKVLEWSDFGYYKAFGISVEGD